MNISFKKEWEQKIMAGTKLSTIRLPRKDGRVPKPGETLKLYTGMRTKACRLLREVRCSDCLPVTMDALGVKIGSDKDYAPLWVANVMAQQDGFLHWGQLWNWFWNQYHKPQLTANWIQWEAK
jgi:hypothetical protein